MISVSTVFYIHLVKTSCLWREEVKPIQVQGNMSKVNLFYVRKSNEVLFFQQSLHNNIMGSMGTTSASDSMQYTHTR